MQNSEELEYDDERLYMGDELVNPIAQSATHMPLTYNIPASKGRIEALKQEKAEIQRLLSQYKSLEDMDAYEPLFKELLAVNNKLIKEHTKAGLTTAWAGVAFAAAYCKEKAFSLGNFLGRMCSKAITAVGKLPAEAAKGAKFVGGQVAAAAVFVAEEARKGAKYMSEGAVNLSKAAYRECMPVTAMVKIMGRPVVQAGATIGRGIASGATAVGGVIARGATAVRGGIERGATAVGRGIESGAKAVGGGIVLGAKAVGKGIESGWNLVTAAASGVIGAVVSAWSKAKLWNENRKETNVLVASFKELCPVAKKAALDAAGRLTPPLDKEVMRSLSRQGSNASSASSELSEGDNEDLGPRGRPGKY